MKSKQNRPPRMETREPPKQWVRPHSDSEGGHVNKPNKDSSRGQIEQFIDAIFGIHSGTVILAQGIDGRLTPNGSYRFNGTLRHCPFAWPGDREAIVIWILKHRRLDDVYVIPNRRDAPNAKAEHGKHGRYVWADLDVVTENTLKLMTPLLSRGSLVVESGGGRGGLHVYLRLDAWYPRNVFQVLNQQLANYLSGDSKFRDNSLLRVPGTLNHKGRAEGGVSRPVILRNESYEAPPWAPEALSAVLGPLPYKSRAKGHTRSQNPVAGRPKIRHQSIALAPIEEVTEELPEDVIQCLDYGRTRQEHGDQSRSGKLYALIATMMTHGYNNGQIMGVALRSEPGQDKWPASEDLAYQIQRCITKLRPDHHHVGQTCSEARCLSNVPHYIQSEASRISQHFRGYYKSSRTLQSDTKIIDACLRRARMVHSLEMDMSQRDLALWAGVTRNTANASLNRLIAAHYVERVLDGNGKPVRAGKGPLISRAFRYRIKYPDVEVEPHNHKEINNARVDNGLCGSTPILDESSDIWRYQGLGSTRRTYEALLDGLQTSRVIAEMLGFQDQTVRKHLKKLENSGLARHSSNGESWFALERSPETISDELGTRGRGLQHADRNNWDRKNRAINLALRQLEDEQDWQRYVELKLDEGFRLTGAYNMFLIPPMKTR